MSGAIAFSYAALSTEIAAELRSVAERVRERGRRATLDTIEVGRDLLKVKARLEHGQWLGWIEAEFAMTDRTARNFMRAAAWAEGKSETVSDLPPTTVYLLSAPSTPPEIANKVLATLESGRRIVPEIVANMVKHARTEAAAKKAQRAQKERREANKKWRETAAERKEQEARKFEAARRKEQEASAEIVTILRAHLPSNDLVRLINLMAVYGVWWDVVKALKTEPDSNVVPLRPEGAAP